MCPFRVLLFVAGRQTHLCEQGQGIRHIPMFGDFTILKTEDVHHIEIEFIAAGRNIQPFTSAVSPAAIAIGHYKVAFRDRLEDFIFKIRHGFEHDFKKTS